MLRSIVAALTVGVLDIFWWLRLWQGDLPGL